MVKQLPFQVEEGGSIPTSPLQFKFVEIKGKLAREDAMKEARLGNPDPTTLRQTLADGICWWCGRRGFKTVANHTSHAHGIMARDIRDFAGLTKGDSIATSGYSEFCKTRPQTLHCERLLASENPPDAPMDFTKEGLRRRREGIKLAQETVLVLRRAGIIPKAKGASPDQLRKMQKEHQARLHDPTYYKNWRRALSSSGRDKRITVNCPICGKPFKLYETTNRKTCGNPECTHTLRWEYQQ